MRAKVAVAESEPGETAVTLEGVHRRPRLAGETPTRLRVHGPCERVHDGVDVGTDVQPVEDDVVTGVDDGGDVGRLAHIEQPPEETCRAHPSGQRGDHPTDANASV